MEIPIKYKRNLLALNLVILILGLINAYDLNYSITGIVTIKVILIIINTILLIQIFRGKVL